MSGQGCVERRYQLSCQETRLLLGQFATTSSCPRVSFPDLCMPTLLDRA